MNFPDHATIFCRASIGLKLFVIEPLSATAKMCKILIVYGTKEGQTAKIAECMGEVTRQNGFQADIRDTRQIRDDFPVEGYAGILVGASIHMGRWSSTARRFVRRYRSRLDTVPSAFFSVSLTDASATPQERSAFSRYVESFFNESGWEPEIVGRFAGALAYTRYGFCTRFLMKHIAQSSGKSTDTSRDHEYTDWDEVTKFAKDFIDRCLA